MCGWLEDLINNTQYTKDQIFISEIDILIYNLYPEIEEDYWLKWEKEGNTDTYLDSDLQDMLQSINIYVKAQNNTSSN